MARPQHHDDRNGLSILSDEELASRLCAGDSGTGPTASDILFGRYMDAVWVYAFRKTGNPFDAEDVMGETFEAVWKQRCKFDPARASFQTWLFAVAHKKCVDHWRREGNRVAKAVSLDAEPREDSPTRPQIAGTLASLQGQQLLDAEDRVDIAALLAPHSDKLSGYEREILELKLCDLSSKQIAKILRKSQSSVDVGFHKAVKKLRKAFGLTDPGGAPASAPASAPDPPPPQPPCTPAIPVPPALAG